jgi:hypothetical protein
VATETALRTPLNTGIDVPLSPSPQETASFGESSGPSCGTPRRLAAFAVGPDFRVGEALGFAVRREALEVLDSHRGIAVDGLAVAPPMLGVRMTFGRRINGESGAMGWDSWTSIAAPTVPQGVGQRIAIHH